MTVSLCVLVFSIRRLSAERSVVDAGVLTVNVDVMSVYFNVV